MVVAGAGSFFIILGIRTVSGHLLQFKTLGQLIFSLAIAAVGRLSVRNMKDIVFDLGRGVFLKGVSSSGAENYQATSCRINDIHALQLIPDRHRAGSGGYLIYQLNIVLDTGKRINVVTHPDRDALVRDAGIVASQISKPVWDLIDESFEYFKRLNTEGS